MAQPQSGPEIYEGLSQLAHAIRRSMAAYIAMNMTPEGSAVEDMLANGDKIAQWIGGEALAHDQERRAQPKPGPLGHRFEDRDNL